MKFLKTILILALLPLFIMLGCDDDDNITTPPIGIAPEVVSTNPGENDVNVSTNSTIVVTFNSDMDAATVNSTNFTLKDGTDDVVGTVAYNNKVATFVPLDNLKIATMYVASISSDVKNTSGVSLANNYSFSFTTGLFVDNTAPTIVSTSPEDND